MCWKLVVAGFVGLILGGLQRCLAGPVSQWYVVFADDLRGVPDQDKPLAICLLPDASARVPELVSDRCLLAYLKLRVRVPQWRHPLGQ